MGFQPQFIILCRYAAHGFAVTIGHEQLYLCMLEVGIFARVKMFITFQKQGCHPMRITGVNNVSCLQKIMF